MKGSRTRARKGVGGRGRSVSRRGVVSVLAMMFVVMFGSLAVAMAVASKGNLRTAQTHLHVNRAMGAAETGMMVAQQRLVESARRFVITKGEIDPGFGERLWSGTTTSADGDITILPAANGVVDVVTTTGIADALLNAHLSDENYVDTAGFPSVAERFDPGAVDPEFSSADQVRTSVLAIDADGRNANARPAAFQITYALLDTGTDVRITVTGFSSIGSSGSDYMYSGSGAQVRPVTRVIQQDFQLAKRPEHAIVSPSRIMIGKNVLINGDMGARYTDVAQNNGHPLVIRSDFRGIDAALDAKLDLLDQGIDSDDVNDDNRLRPTHGLESNGLPSGTELADEGMDAGAFSDVTGDGQVDEFDIFINHYDTDGDGRLVLSASLTAGTPADGLSAEFTLDDDLALLIDNAVRDRNRNGVSGWDDANSNGRWDPGETILDVDPVHGTLPDVVLGWRDGVIDYKDQYAKVRGSMKFAATRVAWSSAQIDMEEQLRGPVITESGEPPMEFGLGADELPEVDAGSFTTAQTPLTAAADGASFESQVASQLGIAVGDLPTYVETGASTDPRYWRADLDNAVVFAATGRHLYEKMPFNSPAFSDYYYRPRYENMVFKDVEIPRGTNALFINCTFVGVTYVRTYVDNAHPNWGLYGQLVWDDVSGQPQPTTSPLDKSDFLRYTTGNVIDGPANYDEFPDPPVIDGVTVTGTDRNTKLYSNNIRFHDCLFVGSIVSDTPVAFTHTRNKIQYTGSTRFTTEHPDSPGDAALNPDSGDLNEILKSSMLLPSYSVDIGSFNSPTDTYVGGPDPQHVDLQGTVVAGVLDARGNTTINGTLMLTFAPVAGQGPLQQNGVPVGNPAGFNTTLGYFGPDDGDGESLDPDDLPVVSGKPIVGWDLDGDGLVDLDHTQTPDAAQIAAGATAIPFYGYGRIELNWDPDLPMPDGIALPVSVVPQPMTYREGVQ